MLGLGGVLDLGVTVCELGQFKPQMFDEGDLHPEANGLIPHIFSPR